MAGISAAHKAEGLSSPTDSLLIKKLIKGYRCEHEIARVGYDFHPSGDDEEDCLRATENFYAPREADLLQTWK